MTTATTNVSVAREPRLLGQTVVVIGGTAGIGLEIARLARTEGGEVVVTGRDPDRLEQAARELSARSSAAFDADDAAAVKRFFDALAAPIDHVLIAAYTRGSYGPMLDLPPDDVGQSVGRRVTQVLDIAGNRRRRCGPAAQWW
jgi:NAD(P)-dependent dehydrogenase (short-subunit alcohol dehydrogenase family)